MTTLAIPNPAASPTPSMSSALGDLDTESGVYSPSKKQRASYSSLDTAASAGLEVAGRVADVIDFGVSLPKIVGDFVGGLSIPGVSWASSTVGAIFAGSLGVLVHGSTFGAAKWVQGLRRWHGVEGGLHDAAQGLDELPSISAQIYLGSVRDPQLRADLTDYFSLHTQLKEVRENTTLSDEVRNLSEATLTRQLSQMELKLGRRSELVEIQEILGAEEAAQKLALEKIELRAEALATQMIERIQSSYKERLGVLGSEMKGSWASLAAQGESGKEALKTRIKLRLTEEVKKEQRGEKALSLVEAARAELHEAFLTKATFREAGFYAVLGALLHTGALGGALHFVQENADKFGDGVLSLGNWVYSNLLPEAARQLVDQGLLYAKLALGVVTGLAGAKVASVTYGVGKFMSDTFSFKGTADAPHVDAAHAAPEVRTEPAPSPIHQHLDAIRAETSGSPVGTGHYDASSLLQRATGGEISHPLDIKVDVTPHTHAEIRGGVEGVKIDPSRIVPEVHVK